MKAARVSETFVGMLDFYDPSTDTIYAKKGTITYYHELGHRVWFMKGIEQRIQSLCWLILLCSIFLIGINITLELGIICFIPLGLLLLSEFHAWYYALKNYRKN